MPKAHSKHLKHVAASQSVGAVKNIAAVKRVAAVKRGIASFKFSFPMRMQKSVHKIILRFLKKLLTSSRVVIFYSWTNGRSTSGTGKSVFPTITNIHTFKQRESK